MARLAFIIAVPLLLVHLLVGCAKHEPLAEVSPDAGAPAPRALVRAKMAVQDKTCYLPICIALDQGYFEDAGLQIEHQRVIGGIEAAEAIVSGVGELGVMGDAPVVIALSRSADTRLVICQALGERMHRIVVRTDSGIKEPRDFEGKRLAVQLGSSTHGGFLRYCDVHGVDVSKIQIMSLSPRDFPEAMMAKQVDFIAGSEPWPGNVMAACSDCKEFANLEGLGSSYPQVVLARVKFLEENPEAAAAIVGAIEKANGFIAAQPDKAAQILSARSGVPVERERKAMDDYEWIADMRPEVIDSLRITAEFLKSQGKIDEVPDIEGRIWGTPPR